MKPTLAAALKLLAAAMLLFASLSVPATRAGAASPAPVPAAAQLAPGEAPREIAALLSLLRQSACRFERNGRWYDGPRAAEHLQRKLDYATGRGQAPTTTEAFIELAATRSSLSGRAYRVQCGDTAARPARDWFLAELRKLRTPG